MARGPGQSGDARWAATKVITIPAEPAPAEQLPPLLQGFGAVPPLVTDIDLSVDDRFLYVSCWGTGELKQYDVSDPFHPRETGSVRIGGIVGRVAHPSRPDQRLRGGPQMVEVSRDGERVYFTNSLYGAWDEQFYPDGVGAWMAKLDVARGGGIAFDERFFPAATRSAAAGCTRSGCRAATPPATRTATRDALSVLGSADRAGPARGVPRDRSRHGLAVRRSFGLQERSRRAVVRSLPPIALGHVAAIAIMIVVLTITSSVFASKVVALVGGLILLAFGLWSIRRKRHVRWVGMRLPAGSSRAGRSSCPRRTGRA